MQWMYFTVLYLNSSILNKLSVTSAKVNLFTKDLIT